MSRLMPIFSAVLLIAASAIAQTATAPGPGTEHLKAKVTGIEGIVQVRAADDQPWQKATVGMEVGENAEFRTGPRSAVRFVIPPDQTVTLDRLGTVKVLQAINDNGKLKTDLGMRYGRTRYDIEAGGREHESTIVSPSSTLAVRGTKVSVFDQRPFPAEAVSLTGRAEFRDFKKRVAFGGKNAGKTSVNTESSNPAALALNHAVVDPSISRARTEAERGLVSSLLSSGATVSFDYDRGIRVVRGGSVPQTDAQLIPALPGVLNFVLRWTGNADINLTVVTPGNGSGNFTLYPMAGFDKVNGGVVPFDHRGGANGGIEVAYWTGKAPEGVYFVGAQHISGPNVPATLDVFKDGKRVPIRSAQGEVTTATAIIQPINPDIASGIGIGTVRLFSTPAKLATPKAQRAKR